jgi:LysR family transcriptional regulator, transcriptional activator of the cysJI operon
MDLEARLRAFAAVSRRRSFSAAARELGISQPAVSKHVADIERRLGVRLIERGRRGAELTAAGAFLANYVLRAEALLAQAARGVTEFRQPPTGLLTIAASGVPATYLLPEVAIAFQRAHPGVRVSILTAPSAQTMEVLRAHRADFGVVGGFAAAPEIEAEPLVEEEIVVVGSPRQYTGRRLSRRDAEAATWIVPREGAAFRAAVEAAWDDLGVTPAHRLELPTVEGVKLAVARGDGVAGFSRFSVEEELRRGSLVLLRLRGWRVRRTISIVRPRGGVLTPSAREFVAMLRARWSRAPANRRRNQRAMKSRT